MDGNGGENGNGGEDFVRRHRRSTSVVVLNEVPIMGARPRRPRMRIIPEEEEERPTLPQPQPRLPSPPTPRSQQQPAPPAPPRSQRQIIPRRLAERISFGRTPPAAAATAASDEQHQPRQRLPRLRMPRMRLPNGDGGRRHLMQLLGRIPHAYELLIELISSIV